MSSSENQPCRGPSCEVKTRTELGSQGDARGRAAGVGSSSPRSPRNGAGKGAAFSRGDSCAVCRGRLPSPAIPGTWTASFLSKATHVVGKCARVTLCAHTHPGGGRRLMGEEASPKPLGSAMTCPCPGTTQAQRCGQNDLVLGDTDSHLHPVLLGRHGRAQFGQPRPNHALPPHPSPTAPPAPTGSPGQIQDFRTSASRAKCKMERGRDGAGCAQGAPYVPPPGQRCGFSWVLAPAVTRAHRHRTRVSSGGRQATPLAAPHCRAHVGAPTPASHRGHSGCATGSG